MSFRVMLLVLACPCVADAQPTVSWLSPLVGVWATTDTYHPVSGPPIVESAVQTLAPNAQRDRWIIEDLAVIGDDGGSNEHWSELVIDSPERIVWTGRRVTGGVDPKTAPISFHEIWTRSSR